MAELFLNRFVFGGFLREFLNCFYEFFVLCWGKSSSFLWRWLYWSLVDRDRDHDAVNSLLFFMVTSQAISDGAVV